MRQKTKNINDTIFCNMCGKDINKNKGIFTEDFLEGYKEWGYFSDKDLEVHRFNLCEGCYGDLIQSFKRPVQVSHKTEVLYPNV